ncbi:hypothetical protein BJ878DRAFT_509084 [Calycina marina]|uniref:Peptidase S54 rhomboid domain-containing protein n=1 Tax=Calycina marina TaxID=1763456 RepID=A0A9P7Z1F7_9HELO|nr:hypothetical protein BJ878DRAFT_509084 [Calycina marina]
MLSSGFTDAPVSRSLVYFLIGSSILVSITDLKHYFYIQIVPHIWTYHQVWRVLIYQLCYINSTEVLFAAMMLYNMRVIERLWGSRKYASFILLTLTLTTILPPLLLALFIRPLSLNTINYLPAGPTPLIFALLAQYHATIPQIYKYRIAASSSSSQNTSPNLPTPGLVLSDKSTTYLPALQLCLSQFPGSAICALVGWFIGSSWRNDVLPGRITGWRLPGWMVGVRTVKRGEGFEGLRRRLEGENTNPDPGAASGVEGRDGGRRRTLGRQLVDQFRGAF